MLKKWLNEKFELEADNIDKLTKKEVEAIMNEFMGDSMDILVGKNVIEIDVCYDLLEVDIYKYKLSEYVDKYGDDILYKYGILEE